MFLFPVRALTEFPIVGLVALVIIFGSIFLWEWHRKSLAIAWLACWVWFCFTDLVAQYSAPLWYHVRDDWGYTFAGEESWPVTAIIAALFLVVGFSLGRIALQQRGSPAQSQGVRTEQVGKKNEL
jgi:hypothetical protein